MKSKENDIGVVFDILKEYFGRYKENNKELQVRCFYCGDSRSKPNKMSLYISKEPVEPYNTYMFHCFRASCGMSGTLLELLRDTELINRPEITKDILKQLTPKFNNDALSKQVSDKPHKSVSLQKKLLSLIKNNEEYSYKLTYVQQRLQRNIIPDYILKTIVTDIRPFLPYARNEIKESLKNYLINNFVCFRTYKLNKLICRNIDHTSNFRYYNIQLNNGIDYYVTSPQLNQLSLIKKGTVILAEGIFTLLHGYDYLTKHKDLINLNSDNIILAATGGGGNATAFYNLFKFLCLNFGVIDWDIVILSDLEVSPEQYSRLRNLSVNKISVLYNAKGDFGDINIQPSLFTI